MRTRLKPMRFLRILGASLVIAWLFRTAGLSDVKAHLLDANPYLLLLATGISFLEGCARVLNWQQLLHSMHEVRSRYLKLGSAYFYSALLGQLVPSTVGTDAIRIVITQRAFGGSPAVYAASLVVLNGVTLFAGAALGLGALLGARVVDQVPAQLLVALPILLGIVVALPALYALLRARRDILIHGLRRMRRSRWFGLRRGLRRFIDALLVFDRSSGGNLGMVLLTSFLVIVVQATMIAVTASAFDVELPSLVWLALPTLLAIIGLMPLSVFGFGAQQGLVVLVLTAFGVPAATALACALLVAFIATTVFLLSGGIAFATWSGPVPRLDDPDSAGRLDAKEEANGL